MADRSREENQSRQRSFGIWQAAGAAAAIVLAAALGSWFLRPAEERTPVGSSPTASVPGSTAPAATATPAPTATPVLDLYRIYFARDGLPPVGIDVAAAKAGSAEERITRRIGTLLQRAGSPPAGAVNAIPARRDQSVFTPILELGQVKVTSDLATVDFRVERDDWQVRGSTQTMALLQQLIYTASEEPGIRRVLITTNGKQTQIDQFVMDKPLTREDVFGYASSAKPQSIEDAGDGTVADIVDWRASVDDVAPGLGRFVVELRPTNSTEPRPFPTLTAKLEQVTNPNDAGKWIIRLELPDAVWHHPQGEAFHCCPLKEIGKTPIRQLAAYPLGANPQPLPRPGNLGGGAYRGVGFAVALDDARPWRVAVLHNPLRVVVDVGGRPQATSDSVAVYSPRPGDTSRTVTISGFARAYEANVAWRIKDSAGRRVAEGFTMTNIGTSAVWGSFQTTATIPANVSGNVTLEVTGNTGREGADMDLVQVPLTVR